MRLDEYLHEHGVSMDAFGSRVGVSHATVSRWCNGDLQPDGMMALKIVRATDGKVNPEDLAPRAAAAARDFTSALELYRARSAPRAKKAPPSRMEARISVR
jgi:DNA-binding transcriptional regulator YdaS (Cro superfamily)